MSCHGVPRGTKISFDMRTGSTAVLALVLLASQARPDDRLVVVDGLTDLVVARGLEAVGGGTKLPNTGAQGPRWKLDLEGGKALGPASAGRTGHAYFTSDVNSTAVLAEVEARGFVVSFDKYRLTLGRVKVLTGSLRADIGRVRVLVNPVLYHSPCRLDLFRVQVTRLDDITVRMTGLSALNPIYSSLSSWFTNKYRDSLRYLLNQKIREFLDKMSKSISICPRTKPPLLYQQRRKKF